MNAYLMFGHPGQLAFAVQVAFEDWLLALIAAAPTEQEKYKADATIENIVYIISYFR